MTQALPGTSKNFLENDVGRVPEKSSSSSSEDEDQGNFIIDLDAEEREDAQTKFNILKEMFPEAEIVFIQAKSAEYALNSEAFQAFIINTMISGNYPKEKDKLSVGSTSDSNNNAPPKTFNLDTFLSKYPNPVAHFSNVCCLRYLQHACNFLQLRYKFHSAIEIRSALKDKRYILYLADQDLKNAPATRKNKRSNYEIRQAFGIPPEEFHDTVDFIERNEDIMRHLNERQEGRKRAVEEARLINELFTCGCCFDDEVLFAELKMCTEGHTFCQECVQKSAEVSLGDGKIDFLCLQECSGYFDPFDLKDMLPANAFEKLEKKLQAREVVNANISGLESCPFCEYCAIPPPGDRIFKCESCKKESCRLCRGESHIPFKCAEMQSQGSTHQRTFVEEKMTEALVRTCWRCQVKYLRIDGCNKMICGSCRAMMCYICRQPVKGYDHFFNNTETPGLRTNTQNLCPLWTSNSMHEVEVREGLEAAIAVVKRTNPNIDPSVFLKKPRNK